VGLLTYFFAPLLISFFASLITTLMPAAYSTVIDGFPTVPTANTAPAMKLRCATWHFE
jgi:hypothetical protein